MVPGSAGTRPHHARVAEAECSEGPPVLLVVAGSSGVLASQMSGSCILASADGSAHVKSDSIHMMTVDREVVVRHGTVEGYA